MIKTYPWYPTVCIALAVLMLVWAGCDSTDAMDEGAVIEGQVVNATDRPVRGATVALSGSDQTATTDSEGTFALTGVEDGSYTLTYSADGYQSTTGSVTVRGDDVMLDASVLQGPATITGRVVDAQTGQGTPGATIIFVREGGTGSALRASVDVGDDEVADLVAETADDGTYAIQNAPTGRFRLAIRRDGYAEDRVENVVVEEGENAIDPRPISEELAEGELRIVLSWGESPSDLDAHLTGPLAPEGRFHVYYANQEPNGANANLDLDDVTSYGPETITVTGLRDGLYRYSIHNYSNQSADGAVGIYESPAEVRFYTEDGLVDVYDPPEAAAGDGNTWRVFEFSVEDGSLSLDDADGSTLGYETASSSGDVDTFLQGPGEKPALPLHRF